MSGMRPRVYIRKNLKHMDSKGLEYIMMLRTSFRKYNELADAVVDKIRSYKNELLNADNEERYGLTTDCTLYDDIPHVRLKLFGVPVDITLSEKASLPKLKLNERFWTASFLKTKTMPRRKRI